MSARYFILHKYGGIYADLDMQCLTSFDILLDQVRGVVVSGENQKHKDGQQRIGNAIILSSKNHPFWAKVFQGLLECFEKSNAQKISSVFVTTGPSFLHEVYVKNAQGVTVLPFQAFYPMEWHLPMEKMELVSRKQYPNSWAVHHWAGNWRDNPREFHFPYQDQYRNFDYVLTLNRNKKDGFGIIEQTIVKNLIPRQGLLTFWSQYFGSQ